MLPCFVSLPEITVKRHKVCGGIVSETFSLVYSYEHIGYLLLGNSNAMCNFSGLTNADFTPFFSKYTHIRIPLPSCVISFTSPNSPLAFILFGRCGDVNKHPGNIRFREKARELAPSYEACGDSKPSTKCRISFCL